jgi:hypothetical protein
MSFTGGLDTFVGRLCLVSRASQDLATDRPKSATKEAVLVEVSAPQDYVVFLVRRVPAFRLAIQEASHG